MKLVLALLFALVTIVNAPASCAHARGVDAELNAHQVADKGEHGPAMHDDDAHHQHTVETPHEHQKSNHGCASDCDGGTGCEGCTIGATAILIQDGDAPHAAPCTMLAEMRDIHHGDSFATDPPPPRAG